MVDIVSSPPQQLSVTVRPNSSIRQGEALRVLAVALPVGALIATGLIALGAWPAVPFLAATLLTIVWAFRAVARHATDYERITLVGDRLAIDRHQGQADEHFEFNALWVELIHHDASVGGCDYLALRSHGRELPLGHDMTDAERASLRQVLRGELRRIRR